MKYVFIKGVASASYYKESNLRMMGDVDVLIDRYDTEKVHSLLQTIGYTTDEDIFKENGHIVYKRGNKGIASVCEVHFSLNGIPNSLSLSFEKYLGNIFDTTKEIAVSNGKCLVPSDFHHGIVLLLYTANHLTHEGVGLRHLCDWAVLLIAFLYVAKMDDGSFWYDTIMVYPVGMLFANYKNRIDQFLKTRKLFAWGVLLQV